MTPDLYADPQNPALPKADMQLNAAGRGGSLVCAGTKRRPGI